MKLKINTPKGKYYYQFVPIYVGMKTLDKEIARENLLLLKALLDEHGIPFCLAFGTLLGAVREKDFIAHDEDIDLMMLKGNRDQLLALLWRLQEKGFEVARYEPRGLLSIIRKGEYIDFYFFEEYPEDRSLYHCCRDLCPKEFLDDTTLLPFQGADFQVPKDYERYLAYTYGEDWRTPIPMYNFQQPNWKRKVNIALQYAKAWLPEPLVRRIQQRSDLPYLAKWREKAQKFKTIKS